MSKQKVLSYSPAIMSAVKGSHARQFYIDANCVVPGEEFLNLIPFVISQDGIAQLRSPTIPLPWMPPCKLFHRPHPAGTTTLSSGEETEADKNKEILEHILEEYIGPMRELTEAAEASGVKFLSTGDEIKFDNPDEASMLLRRVRQMVDQNLLLKQPKADSYAIIKNALYTRLSCCHKYSVRLVRFSREYIYALVQLGGPNLLNAKVPAATASLVMHYSGFGPINLLP